MKRWQLAALPALAALLAALCWWYFAGAGAEPAPMPAPLPAAAPVATAARVDYQRDVKPILENRCLVCHGCYDAPCQLKLDSPEGLVRGATTVKVYDSTRLIAAAPTRLFIDAHSEAEWRERGFFSVLGAGDKNAEPDLQGSVLYRMLQLKNTHPQPAGELPASVDVGLERKEFCPSADNFSRYARERPLEGMPFGLPGLSAEEFAAVERWLSAGAPLPEPPALAPAAQRAVADWENFLNGDALKTQLMSRYLYEHLFLAALYLDDGAARQFFRIVRSRTPPGTAVDEIASRRPFDDPGAARVYYRLEPQRAAVLAKTHMPYAFGPARMQRYRELFLDPAYTVSALPSYAPEVAANPFAAFAALPVRSRYGFLLDDAEFVIMNFIKGPVCRGQLALNVIDDRFWVLFANPDIEAAVDAEFLARERNNLQLPAEAGQNPLAAVTWLRYSNRQADYLQAKAQFLRQKFGEPDAVTLSLLWNGGGANTNAALTVFRHFDTASVVRGLVGEVPKTAWVIDYPMLERIHYLLVAGFDVNGDASHQLLTRLYMDFLRMEGEYNFLAFLPRAMRARERNAWYQGVGAKWRDSVYRKVPPFQRETGVVYRSQEPKREFFEQVRGHLGAALAQRYELRDLPLTAPALQALRDVGALRGRAVASMPEVVFLRVIRKNAPDEVFSLLHNADHSNVAVLLLESERRRPRFDTLTVAPGFIGAYPNAFWRVAEDELPELARALAAVNGPETYRAVRQRFAVARGSDRFWRQSDWMHGTYRERAPLEWGVLDYNRYER